MSFTVTTEPRENRQLAVTIEVGQERVEKELRKAAAKVANQYKVPGFRKGKAPYHIIVQQFGLANLYGEFIDDLGQVLFREAVEQEKIEPYAQSSLEDIQLEPLTYKLIVPLEPEIKLADYRAMRVEADETEIDESQVEQRLEQYREEFAGWQDVERPTDFGDLLTVDVKSVILGDEGAEETVVLDETDWDITLDEENPMEPAGFDRELLGMKAGESKEFVLGWPADSQSIYAGKQATFNVTVKSVQAYEKPELNDDFAKLVGPDYETIEDLKKSIRESIEEGERGRAESQYIDKVLDALVEASEIDYPPIVIEDQIDGMMQDMDQRLRQIGIDGMSAFLRQTNQDEEEYREQMRPDATKIALRNLVMSEVVKQESFEIDDAEIEERIKQMVGVDEDGNINESSAALADLLRQGAGRNMILSQLLTEKAVNLLQAAARGEEVPAPKAKVEAAAETENAEAETAADERVSESEAADAE
ncbi:MAG: trigger factor [Caldilinea sp.]|nr:trigger factor [Caldilineaceae bacterium]MCB9119055.1 trigger factor [Caldilineaceae bacterium]MCW5844830.1 trigger factor [Caldilinea sp.]